MGTTVSTSSAVGLSEGEVVGLAVGVAWVIMEDSILH